MEEKSGGKGRGAKRILLIGAAIAAAAAVAAAALLILRSGGDTERGKSYVIRDGNTTLSVMSEAETPEEVLAEAGVSLANARYEVTTEDDATVIVIERAPAATVACDGEETVVTIFGTVADALEAAGVTLGEGDTVSPPLTEKITDGMQIEVARSAR